MPNMDKQAGQASEPPLPERLGLLRLVIVGKAVNIRVHGQGKALGVVFAAQDGARLGRQRFHKNKAHAVRVVRTACGICADARPKR